MSQLFDPLTLRGTTIRNRVWLSPMCQYRAQDGLVNDWHLMHLGARAAGGAGLVLTEAAAVTPEGRISPQDTGIWNDDQTAAWGRIVRLVQGEGATAGIQLAHAGRKASTDVPWLGRGVLGEAEGGWQTVAPSPVGYGGWPTPKELSLAEIAEVVRAFADAARRADEAGFDLVEIHAAHGYLLHEFCSPLTNRRLDGYGGDFAGRTRIVVEVADAVRAVWPDAKPLILRVSATDWVEGGWDVAQTVELARTLAEHGVDLIDVSSGGLVPEQQVVLGPGYQVPFARAVREGSGLPVGTVGLITEAAQAQQILDDGSADAVFLGRALLRDPAWPLRAAHELGATASWPLPYARGAWA